MAHLSSGEFVDRLEGARDDESAPHLAECDRCRRQLADLRQAMAAATLTDVPEPSPLFWDHLSARVRDAVAHATLIDEGRPARAALFNRWWVRGAAGAAVCALVIAAMAALGSRGVLPAPSSSRQPEPPGPSAGQSPLALLGSADDPSLDLVADFGATLNWDDLREQMAVSPLPGALEAGVDELDGGERTEIERLLKEELARPGGRTGRS